MQRFRNFGCWIVSSDKEALPQFYFLLSAPSISLGGMMDMPRLRRVNRLLPESTNASQMREHFPSWYKLQYHIKV